jgi:hypothetical protein
LGHTKIESTVRYLGIEVDDALAIASMRKGGVARDLPLEGTRFEPSVPRRDRCFKDRPMSPLPDFPRRESQRDPDIETGQDAGIIRGTEESGFLHREVYAN